MRFPKPIDFGELLATLEPHYRARLPFALYRKPGARSVRAVLQADRRLVEPITWKDPGFVLAPFDSGSCKAVHLQPDRLLRARADSARAHAPAGCPPEAAAAREAHLKRVGDALAAIRKGELEKVVLARAVPVPLKAHPFRVYERLLAYYPGAFCYMWYHPATGIWMGATPELLLGCSHGEARTVSLAGTLPAQGDRPPAWGPKERHEQQVVTDYICSRLREQGLLPETGSTEAVRAGSLWHLRTPVSVKAGAPQLGKLLDALHPTPAVCGIPLEAARNFITAHESFDREYYTGFLGASGLEQPGDFEFYVNLRCMKINEGQARLYVGGGITGASDPIREWEETRQKCGTVWAAVKNSA